MILSLASDATCVATHADKTGMERIHSRQRRLGRSRFGDQGVNRGTRMLVSRIRSSQHFAAYPFANFGFETALANKVVLVRKFFEELAAQLERTSEPPH
jgi:hypothetical protein